MLALISTGHEYKKLLGRCSMHFIEKELPMHPRHDNFWPDILGKICIKERGKAAMPQMCRSGNAAVPQMSQSGKAAVPHMPPQPKELILTCPICMGKLVEDTSTKCGHIFCKSCIDAALAAQRKCPTCRRKLRATDAFRIYFPTGSN